MNPYEEFLVNRTIIGDCRDSMRELIAQGVKVQMCVTSPPYWGLRDYGVAGQIGLEHSIQKYVITMVEVFHSVRDLLADDGVFWLNIGDCYAGSWGAQSRQNGTDINSTLQGGSMLSARQIAAHPKEILTGSLKNTPGLKPKDLVMMPARVALALQADGWYLRQDIIWNKPNPMPESVLDRCTKAHEYLFSLSKSERYYFDADAISEPAIGQSEHDLTGGYANAPGQQPQGGSRSSWDDRKANGAQRGNVAFNGNIGAGTQRAVHGAGMSHDLGPANGRRNRRSVWTVATQPYSEAHFATFPPALIEPCILAGSRPGDIVFDPFIGSGTTGQVAQRLGRRWLGCELNPEYVKLERKRTAQQGLMLDAREAEA